MKNVKKILYIFIIFKMIGNVYSQQQIPSTSYLSSYIDRPISISTGIPNISIPIFRLDTNNKTINIQTSLNYNIENSKLEDAAGEVGLGWMLTGKGVIKRELKNEVDELYDNSGAVNYVMNDFDDVYYYNLPNGISGKFRFLRDKENNTFSLINLTDNKIKIEYAREINNATLIVTSYTITDSQGIKYFFNDFSQDRYPADFYNKLCRSEFFLSKILDQNNSEIITYSYEKTQHYFENTTSISYTTCKLKSIHPINGGTIEFSYLNEPLVENTLNDPDYLTDIYLLDSNGKMLSKYKLDYVTSNFPYYYTSSFFGVYKKRVLTGIQKQDGDFKNIEKITLSYHPGTRLLERINTSNNGVVHYSFEQSDFFVDKESQFYLNYISLFDDLHDKDVQFVQLLDQIPFDTQNSNLYYINILGDPNKAKVIYIDKEVTNFYQVPVDPYEPIDCMCQATDGSWYINCDDCPNGPQQQPLVINYQLKKDTQVHSVGPYSTSVNQKWDRFLQVYPGLYTIELSGTGGMGNISVYELKLKDPPYKRSFPFDSYRINNVKYFDTSNNNAPLKSTTYIYTDFLDNTKSSGYPFNYLDSPSGEKFVLYKNVKVVEEGIDGFTKYYFKTPDDYPKSTIAIGNTMDNTYSKYYISSMSGVMDKKEVYNALNQKVTSIDYETVFEELPNADYFNIYLGLYTKLAYTKSNKITEKLYDVGTGGYLQKTSENIFNLHNYAISSSIQTTADGFKLETGYQYALEKNNFKLLGADMLTIPLEVTKKQNGKLIEKIENFYDHSDNLFPSSVKSSGINGVLIKEEKYDVYDSMGNVWQTTPSGTEYPTTIIWGYNSTQPIAKIEGIKYADLLNIMGVSSPSQLDIVTKSNQDIDDGSEQLLRDALETFRKKTEFKNYLITTYTYDPLIGVKSVTSPNGFTEYYFYDNAGRQSRIEDSNHNVIKEFKYSPSLTQ